MCLIYVTGFGQLASVSENTFGVHTVIPHLNECSSSPLCACKDLTRGLCKIKRGVNLSRNRPQHRAHAPSEAKRNRLTRSGAKPEPRSDRTTFVIGYFRNICTEGAGRCAWQHVGPEELGGCGRSINLTHTCQRWTYFAVSAGCFGCAWPSCPERKAA